MSEVANISEIQEKNTVPPLEQNAVEKVAAEPANTPKVAEAEAEAPTVTEKQVVNNNIEAEAAAGDAGTSAAEAAKPAESSPKVENKKSPVKRTPSKRMSFIERAQKESEELVKNMGGSLEMEGGRRTRSSARGTPTRGAAVSTPPPAKKARSSPANASSTPSRGRGRGRKIDISEETEEAKDVTEPKKAKTPEKGKAQDKKQSTNKSNNTTKEASKSRDKSPASTVDDAESEKKKEDETDASTSAPNVEQSKDKTDAKTDEESVTTEKHINDEQQPSDISKETAENTAAEEKKNNEAPMETDESPTVEETQAADSAELAAKDESRPAAQTPAAIDSEVASTPAPASAPVELVKDATPEPMDVDSNSKSSDVELIETAPAVPVAKDVVDNAVPNAKAAEATQEVGNKIDAIDVDAETGSDAVSTQAEGAKVAPPAPTAVGNEGPTGNALNATNEIEGNPKAEAATIAPAGSEAIAAAVNEVNANNDESVKPENDLCVPKIVSPSINNANNDGTVTTIL